MEKHLQIIGYLLAISLAVSGQTTTIMLSAPGYENQSLQICSYTDYLSFTPTTVATVQLNDSAKASATFQLLGTTQIYIETESRRYSGFAEVGENYVAALLPKRERTMEEQLNPFFVPEGIYLFSKINRNATDVKIRAFDDRYYHFLSTDFEAVYYRFGMTGLKQFAQRLDSIIPAEQDSFYIKYKTYRIAQLKYMGRPTNRSLIIRKHFAEKPIDYQNPAYWDLVRQLFGNYAQTLSTDSAGNALLKQTIGAERNIPKTDSIFAVREQIANPELRQLLLAYIFRNAFYNRTYPRTATIALLDSLHKHSSSSFARKTAQYMRTDLATLAPGAKVPSFKLYNKDSLLISPKTFEGRFVYLNFMNTQSYVCQQDLEVLKSIHSRMFEVLEVVTIVTDNDFDRVIEMAKQNEYNWVFLHMDNKSEIIKTYKVRSFPTYFLLAPDGTFKWSPGYTPHENFETKYAQVWREYQRDLIRSGNE